MIASRIDNGLLFMRSHQAEPTAEELTEELSRPSFPVVANSPINKNIGLSVIRGKPLIFSNVMKGGRN